MKAQPHGSMRFCGSILVLLSFATCLCGFAAEGSNADEKVVNLPPFIVDQLNVGPPWRYVSIPGTEFLTRVEDDATTAFVRGERRSQHLIDLILPRSFQEKGDAQESVILYSQYLKPKMPKVLMDDMMNSDRGPKRGLKQENIGFLPNLRLMDSDYAAGFVYLQEGRFRGRLVYTPDFVRFLLEHRTPQLPSWFIEGFILFYSGIELHEYGVTIPETQWLTEKETEGIRRDPDYPRALLPMQAIFACGMRRAATMSELQLKTREAQTVLFIRWALSGRPERKRAFWTFVERSCLEAPTEKLFMECFGFGYADARDRLSDMLSRVVHESSNIEVGSIATLEVKIRDATTDEITRIKGDWERMQIRYIRKVSPQFAEQYEEQAEMTFGKVYMIDKPSPELSMAQGFFECERGHNDEARVLLEAAVKGKVARPRAYLELAKLRMANSKANPFGAKGKLSESQLVWVLEPLAMLQNKRPQMLESYRLYAAALFFSEHVTTKEELAVLARGVKLFPKSGMLALRAAWLHLFAGDKATAGELVQSGLTFSEDLENYDRLMITKEKLLNLSVSEFRREVNAIDSAE